MKRIFAFVLLLCMMMLLNACNTVERSAGELLVRFIDVYGIGGVTYFSDAPSGGECMDDELFLAMYGTHIDSENDFAVFLSSSLDHVYEAAVFVTYDSSSELDARKLCSERIALLKKMGFGEDAILLVRRGVVFYSTLADSARAQSIWLDINV